MDIVIEPADKGDNIVIMNRMDYIQEGLRQMNNTDHYAILDEGPTSTYNEQILQLLQQGVNLNIIDEKTLKSLYKNHQKYQTSTCYQRSTNQIILEDLL